MGANFWDPVIQLLEGEFRCLTPELPVGAHQSPMRPDADVTTAGVGALTPLLALLKFRPVRSLPTAYGWLTHHQPPHELIAGWIANYLADKDVRRETRRLIATLGDDAFMGEIAAELAGFTKPVLLLWAADEKFFPPRACQSAGRHPSKKPACSSSKAAAPG